MKKGLFALAAGTLGFGMTEYVMMGILPNIANDLGISTRQPVISSLPTRWVSASARR